MSARDDMSTPSIVHHAAPCGACVTHVRNLGVRFGRHVALEGVSFDLHCGEITAIVGPNGAGKTTLLRALLGEVPYTGERHFHGGGGSGRTTDIVIGYVPQRLVFDRAAPVTVADLFTLGLGRRPVFFGIGDERRAKAMAGLKEVDAEHLLERRLGELSGGEMQRVLVAFSLVPQPNLLLLDEPAQGLDAIGMAKFHDVVAQLRGRFDVAVALVSHDLEAVARVADKILFLDRTLVASGTPDAVLSNPAVRQRLGMIPG